MKRSLWFSVLVTMLLLAGCSDEKTVQELEPVNEEDNGSAVVEVDEGEVQEEEDQEEKGPEEEDQEEEVVQIAGTENEPPLFDMEDGHLFIYGMTLGDSPSKAEAKWGSPEILDEEHMMDGEAYYHYPAVGMTIGYYEEKLTFLVIEADEGDLKEVIEKFQGDHYRTSEWDAEFFFAPETGQLLIYGTANSEDGEAELRLLMSDDNFFYYVDEGIYEKVPGR
ncbi:hypothetical protein MHZ92_08890 [Sporosarcina sp. ACRSL]|uniref:hypothetical protein n=1 Tax=Sporosarcina sp. ACRSL TaxID=2918215 RepID=UPI001EF6D6FD|nr:hypothetical protein [Sporosarcina sp. ACRSL]MCG7344248.1 hypothetical protein [Sporosarcina sp. ACRSL]